MTKKMTKEEYIEKMKVINHNAEIEKQKVKQEYAFSNNSYKIGDIIKDHYQIIKIEKVNWVFAGGNYPECVYTGIKLKKDLTPFISGEKSQMWQSNVEELIHE